MRLSNSQRTFLYQATEEYAKHLHLAEQYLSTRHLSVEEGKKFHLGIVKDPLPGHESYKGRLNNINTTNTNEDGNLPEIEKEAYEKGNMMLRNWEDKIKNV